MAVAILIGLWINDELSFNTYHENYNSIARVMRMETWHNETGAGHSQTLPLGITLRNEYKKDFKYVVMATWPNDNIVAAGDKKFTQSGSYMQAEAPYMFTLKMVYGSRDGLKDMNSILITQSLSKKLFGDADPTNKIIKVNNEQSVKVTGVYEDLPGNTDLKDVTFILPWDLYAAKSKEFLAGLQDNWSNNFLAIYVQLAPGADFASASAKIRDLKRNHVSKEEAQGNPRIFLHPMAKWHLYNNFENGKIEAGEQMKFVWFYATIGMFVLLLACINFMNLSTARSEKRAKEVGIRKAIGSGRGKLINQFFSESLLVSGVAFIIALLLVLLMLPWFNNVAGKDIGFPWGNAWFWLAGLSFSLITGLLAGVYPALYLSSFKPVKVLKGVFRAGRLAAMPRKVLVVVQFTVSIMLIIGTIVVYRQIQFAKNRPVGYSRDGLLAIKMTSPDFYGKYDVLRSELQHTGAVSEMAEAASPLTDIYSENNGFSWQGMPQSLDANFGTLSVTYEYGKTIGWQFIAGRDFAKGTTDDSGAMVINEEAAKVMNMKDPVGQTVNFKSQWYKSGNYKILGVIKNMVMTSPFEPAYPTVFFLNGDKYFIFVKVNPGVSMTDALPKIEAVFKKIIPAAPFDYKFADEDYAQKFAAEERVGTLASFFAVLTIFISCLGLFGLASFVAEQRTKEIGVRKVLGATVVNVWGMLSKDFVVLVTISLLISIPVAYYFMHIWLEQYAYRTEITWWIFAATCIGVLFITLVTVSFQAIKAAVANPVESLRSE